MVPHWVTSHTTDTHGWDPISKHFNRAQAVSAVWRLRKAHEAWCTCGGPTLWSWSEERGFNREPMPGNRC